MLVFSDVQSLCISARLWLQVGSPKRLRSDLNQTVSFPPTLFSSSMLIVYFKSILAHTCTASPLTSVMCSKNFCPFIYCDGRDLDEGKHQAQPQQGTQPPQGRP